MQGKTNWKLLEECKDDYKLYFRFVAHEGKSVKIYKCAKEQPNNTNEGGYFNKDSARQIKGV